MPAGRPPELDSNGNAIAKCLVNVTIPTKLRDFLRQHDINRSELFRTAALKLKNLEICPHCYSHDINETHKGWQCGNSSDSNNWVKGHDSGTGNCGRWLKYKRCELCEAAHAPESRVYALGDKVGCDQCPEIIKQKEDNKKINVVFGDVER